MPWIAVAEALAVMGYQALRVTEVGIVEALGGLVVQAPRPVPVIRDPPPEARYQFLEPLAAGRWLVFLELGNSALDDAFKIPVRFSTGPLIAGEAPSIPRGPEYFQYGILGETAPEHEPRNSQGEIVAAAPGPGPTVPNLWQMPGY